ncbi:MAG: hypothetical protein A2W17_01650 [Planctomycetes bacterium RBG_16_41_13]|nr:MAG: hypothetical protein A2W17_01650 [Planctomycetes bacterium RBG_16_41_13]
MIVDKSHNILLNPEGVKYRVNHAIGSFSHQCVPKLEFGNESQTCHNGRISVPACHTKFLIQGNIEQ